MKYAEEYKLAAAIEILHMCAFWIQNALGDKDKRSSIHNTYTEIALEHCNKAIEYLTREQEEGNRK